MDEVFKLRSCIIVAHSLSITTEQLTNEKAFNCLHSGGTKQTNFAICDCLIMCSKARSAADSNTGFIMSHGERFKSLLKGFIASKVHVIFCLLLDTIHYILLCYQLARAQ